MYAEVNSDPVVIKYQKFVQTTVHNLAANVIDVDTLANKQITNKKSANIS